MLVPSKTQALSKRCLEFARRLCLLSYGLWLCLSANANFARFACRLVSVEVLHDTPDASKSFDSAFLVEEVVPLCALQLWTAPIFFDGSLLGHGSCGQILGVSIVNGESENADVVE